MHSPCRLLSCISIFIYSHPRLGCSSYFSWSTQSTPNTEENSVLHLYLVEKVRCSFVAAKLIWSWQNCLSLLQLQKSHTHTHTHTHTQNCQVFWTKCEPPFDLCIALNWTLHYTPVASLADEFKLFQSKPPVVFWWPTHFLTKSALEINFKTTDSMLLAAYLDKNIHRAT